MIYNDRFRIYFKSLYLNSATTTHRDRESGKWKIDVSSEDLTLVTTIWREKVNVKRGERGRLALSYDAGKDFRTVDKTPWNRQRWAKPSFQTGIEKIDMGFDGVVISARTNSDLVKGPIGQKVDLKVTFKGGPDMPSEIVGYGAIQVRAMMSHFKSFRYRSYLGDSIAIDVDLPRRFGKMVFEARPAIKIYKPVRRRAVARGSGLSPYQILKLIKKKLPDCCIYELKLLLRCIKTHETVLKAWKVKGWADKVLKPEWITQTAKMLRAEAYNKIKSELMPPLIPADSSIEGNTIQLSSLILSNTMVHITFGHMMDHSGDGGLYDIWYDINENFKKLKDEAIKKAGGEKELRRKLGAAALQLKW